MNWNPQFAQVAGFFARICARAIFSSVTRIRTHNLSLTHTLPYHWATPSHVTNNEIFFFYHHFLVSYITCFTAITISNEKLFNYKVVDLVASYNFRIYFFFHLRSFENFENLKFKILTIYLGAKTISTEKNLNYKVVDLVASYNFRIYFFSI